MATLIQIPGGSEILLGRNSLSVLDPRPDRLRVAVLSQPGSVEIAANVAVRLAEMGLEVASLVLPDGEAAKTLGSAGRVYDWLEQHHIGRGDTLVAVGGGSVTDLGGFVGATWLRGIEVVYVTTTLTGAVDAAIGGKTGLNVGGKNLVGVFSHPRRIVIDFDTLDALPTAILVEGYAEAVKTGYISDQGLVDMVGDPERLAEMVERCVRYKAEVVAEDLRESGRRATLNYGHTIGHAVEMAVGVSHGEAVAVGMVAAAAIADARYGSELESEHRQRLQQLGLPIGVEGTSAEDLLPLVRLDKKRTVEGVRMVLLRGVGNPVVEVVTDEELLLGMQAIGAK